MVAGWILSFHTPPRELRFRTQANVSQQQRRIFSSVLDKEIYATPKHYCSIDTKPDKKDGISITIGKSFLLTPHKKEKTTK